MLERLPLKRSELPSSRGRPIITTLTSLVRSSCLACILTVPSLSFHTPSHQVSQEEQRRMDRMEQLLEETIDHLFDGVTAAEVMHVFTLGPSDFKKTYPLRYEASVILAEALALRRDRFDETYNKFIAILCKNAQAQNVPLDERTASFLFSQSKVKEELALLLQHNRQQKDAIDALQFVRQYIQEPEAQLAFHGNP